MAIDFDYVLNFLRGLRYRKVKVLDNSDRLRVLKVGSDLEGITESSNVIMIKTKKGCYVYSLKK